MIRTIRQLLRGPGVLPGTLLVGVLLSFVPYRWLSANQRVDLRVEMSLGLPHPSGAQVYWTAEAGGFSQERGASFQVRPGDGAYRISLPAGLGRVRIDPLSEPGLVEVRSIRLTRWGVPLRVWGGGWGFEGWEPWNQVADMEVRGPILRMRATGSDPGFASADPIELRWRCGLMNALASLLLGLASGLVLVAASPRARRGMRRIHEAALLPRAGRFLAQSLVILALGACLTEVAMRVYHHFMPVFVFPIAGTDRFRAQPYSLNYTFRLNSHGFKDVEWEPRKRPGTVRVLGIGDSFAFGVVPYEDNYLTLVEKDLAGVSPPVEILNMGIPAIGPPEYVELLVNEGLPLHADMVLLSFFIGNDFWQMEPKPPRSYLYAFLRYLFSIRPKGLAIHNPGPYVDEAPTFGPPEFLQIERDRCVIFRKSNPARATAHANVRRHLGDMKRICDVKGLELLVVIIPDEMQVNAELRSEMLRSFPEAVADFDFAMPNRLLGADLQSLGIRYLDLLGPFEEAGRSQRLYKLQDTHWNIAGNHLAADLIREQLLRDDKRFTPRPGS